MLILLNKQNNTTGHSLLSQGKDLQQIKTKMISVKIEKV